MTYTPASIEPKWQKFWEENKSFQVEEGTTKPSYYVLEMLPYPSGTLHVGHTRNYTLGDVMARHLRATGYNVMHPMGWDSFGLPAENAALKNGVHPQEWTLKNIQSMKQTLNRFGYSYDWNKEVTTCLPNYYGHQQALFIDFFNKGLAYQKESLVNWDPVDNTVLANEQVVDGKGWRSGAPVERRSMTQWFFKITDYAQELLDDLQTLDGWPERVKTMQENWIGRSEGLAFSFQIQNLPKGAEKSFQTMEVYTTRPDTIMGSSFCAIAPEHPLAKLAAESDPKALAFIKECEAMGTAEESIEKAEKKGVKLPFTALHPLTGEALPIYIANFVLMGYGTGAIMAVPAHDERDFEFATKYNLPITQVVAGEGDLPFSAEGTIINSGSLNGLSTAECKEKVISQFEEKGLGARRTNWRLRDWGVSRQRYWGCPIPMVKCPSCGVVAEKKENLPIELPQDVSFDKPGNPLANHPSWKKCTCPKCGGAAERETDTMDTFVDSSWYFARYANANLADKPLNPTTMKQWLPVNQYIGGIEHAVLHLLYARFFTKALRDVGYVDVKEPFANLFCQGMINGPSYQNAKGEFINPIDVKWEGDKAVCKETGEVLKVNNSEKLSKSKNNAAPLDALIEKYGVDTLRLFCLFVGPAERSVDWSERGVEGVWRFLNRVWALAEEAAALPAAEAPAMETLQSKEEQALKRAIHKTIKKVSADLEKMHYNTMVAALMELSNTLAAKGAKQNPALFREGVSALVQMLNPAAPHISEEMWEKLGNSTPLCQTQWLVANTAAAKDDEITLVVQLNGKLKERLQVPANVAKEEAEKQALAAIEPHLAGLQVRKCIVVPGRLVNIVAG